MKKLLFYFRCDIYKNELFTREEKRWFIYKVLDMEINFPNGYVDC